MVLELYVRDTKERLVEKEGEAGKNPGNVLLDRQFRYVVFPVCGNVCRRVLIAPDLQVVHVGEGGRGTDEVAEAVVWDGHLWRSGQVRPVELAAAVAMVVS